MAHSSLLFGRGAAGLAAAGLLIGLGACSVAEQTLSLSTPDLPESADVATAPYPRLVDNPAPVSVDPDAEDNVAARTALGPVIETELSNEADSLASRRDRLAQEPVVRDNLAAEAARLRRRAQELSNASAE